MLALRSSIRFPVVVMFGVLATSSLACGSRQADPAPNQAPAVTPASPVGAWQGTKTYYDGTGTRTGASPDWTFVITSDGSGALTIAGGPSGIPSSPSSFVVAPHDFPATPNPGGPNHCILWSSITGGEGSVAADGSLFMTLRWTTVCESDGSTTRTVTTYAMNRVANLQPGQVSAL